MFPHLLTVQPTAQYKLQLRYDDGTEGVADVSHLAGRGVFRPRDEGDLFFSVKN